MILPMDEALIMTAVDISGRAQLCCSLDIPAQKVGDFDTELCEEFMAALTRNVGMSLHIRQLDGKKQPPHHRGNIQEPRQEHAHGGQNRS